MIFWPGERIFARIVPILFNWLSYFTASSVSPMGGWLAGWSSVEYHVSCVYVLPASKCALCLQNDWIRISNCRILTRSIFMSVEYLHLILVIVCECQYIWQLCYRWQQLYRTVHRAQCRLYVYDSFFFCALVKAKLRDRYNTSLFLVVQHQNLNVSFLNCQIGKHVKITRNHF